jgi:TolB-like protein
MIRSSKRLAAAVLCGVGVFIAACAPTHVYQRNPWLAAAGVDIPQDQPLVKTSYLAAEQLMAQADSIDRDQPVLVASLSDVNDLGRSSALGRIISEQVASRIAQLGYTVPEVKLRTSMAINSNGEFMLSRDIHRLSAEQHAQAVVAGTYASANDEVYVSLRLIRIADGKILGGVDYALPAGFNTRTLANTGW